MTGRQFFGLWDDPELLSIERGAEGRLMDAIAEFMTRGRIQAPEESKQPFFALVVKLSHARGMDQEEGFFRAWTQETAALPDEDKGKVLLLIREFLRDGELQMPDGDAMRHAYQQLVIFIAQEDKGAES